MSDDSSTNEPVSLAVWLADLRVILGPSGGPGLTEEDQVALLDVARIAAPSTTFVAGLACERRHGSTPAVRDRCRGCSWRELGDAGRLRAVAAWVLTGGERLPRGGSPQGAPWCTFPPRQSLTLGRALAVARADQQPVPDREWTASLSPDTAGRNKENSGPACSWPEVAWVSAGMSATLARPSRGRAPDTPSGTLPLSLGIQP